MAWRISVDDRDSYDPRSSDLNTTWRSELERVSVCKLAREKRALPYRWIALNAILFSICIFSTCQAQLTTPSPSGRKFPTLTTARQAHGLSNQKAIRGLPVHLRGVVTYFDPDFGTGQAAIFIHDATGSIFVSQASKPAAQLFVGAMVDVQGVSAPGGLGPVIDNPHIRILGRAPLPRTRPVSA